MREPGHVPQAMRPPAIASCVRSRCAIRAPTADRAARYLRLGAFLRDLETNAGTMHGNLRLASFRLSTLPGSPPSSFNLAGNEFRSRSEVIHRASNDTNDAVNGSLVCGARMRESVVDSICDCRTICFCRQLQSGADQRRGKNFVAIRILRLSGVRRASLRSSLHGDSADYPFASAGRLSNPVLLNLPVPTIQHTVPPWGS
jgi:hypothetical protein